MSTIVSAQTLSPEEYLALPDRERFELVDGRLVEVNVSALSSRVGASILIKLGSYCDARGLGLVWGADNIVRCFSDPNKFRKPDACFVRTDRIPPNWIEEPALEVAPDLVVEVVSPNDTAYDLRNKIRDYLEAGVRLVWVIYPPTRSVSVYRIDGTVGETGPAGDLDGEDVVPGFRSPVAEIFPA